MDCGGADRSAKSAQESVEGGGVESETGAGGCVSAARWWAGGYLLASNKEKKPELMRVEERESYAAPLRAWAVSGSGRAESCARVRWYPSI